MPNFTVDDFVVGLFFVLLIAILIRLFATLAQRYTRRLCFNDLQIISLRKISKIILNVVIWPESPSHAGISHQDFAFLIQVDVGYYAYGSTVVTSRHELKFTQIRLILVELYSQGFRNGFQLICSL